MRDLRKTSPCRSCLSRRFRSCAAVCRGHRCPRSEVGWARQGERGRGAHREPPHPAHCSSRDHRCEQARATSTCCRRGRSSGARSVGWRAQRDSRGRAANPPLPSSRQVHRPLAAYLPAPRRALVPALQDGPSRALPSALPSAGARADRFTPGAPVSHAGLHTITHRPTRAAPPHRHAGPPNPTQTQHVTDAPVARSPRSPDPPSRPALH